jgi:hypothetical protein
MHHPSFFSCMSVVASAFHILRLPRPRSVSHKRLLKLTFHHPIKQEMSDKIKTMMEAAKPSATNGALYILFSGVIFSFGPVLFRLTSIYEGDTTFAGPWRYMLYRFLGMFLFALSWHFQASAIFHKAGSSGAERTCTKWPWVSRQRAWRSALGGGMMAVN